MLQIAICDIGGSELKQIRAATEQYFAADKAECAQISCYEDPQLLFEQLNQSSGFHIVLLDIGMPGSSGMEVAKQIRMQKENSEIVFLSTSDEFAVDAFSLRAAHYIVKPFTQSRFNEAMDRALASIKTEPPLGLPLKLAGRGMCTVDLHEIIYLESFDHKQQLTLKSGETLLIRESLSGLLSQMERMSPGQFLSPYKGYLVNLTAVRAVEPDCMQLYGGKSVPIVRRSFRKLLERWQHFHIMQRME